MGVAHSEDRPILWAPKHPEKTQMAQFIRFVEEETGRSFEDYASFHRWSVRSPDEFWSYAMRWLGIQFEGVLEPVRRPREAPGEDFFPEIRLAFAENLLRYAQTRPDATALVSVNQTRERRQLSFAQLEDKVLRLSGWLRARGVTRGDRVAGYMPNIEEAVIGMLAATRLGAMWSSCSPDFGVQGVLDRFGQIEPKILIAADGYRYGDKAISILDNLRAICGAIASLERVLVVPYLEHAPRLTDLPKSSLWPSALDGERDREPAEALPFNHPLYIMYSSGTTGVPKCIVHGAGGTLLQHAKELRLHCDLGPDDTIMYFTTCGWMMWNWLVSSLFVGASVVLYDGSPMAPQSDRMWELIEEEGITHFGTSPKFLGACRGVQHPGREHDLTSLRCMMSTGAPLLPEDFDWVYQEVKSDLQLASISGGTDIISCFMLGNPMLPVVRGELQCLGLGMDVVALDERGEPVYGRKGELGCRSSFPSMPVGFWRDDNHEKYRAAYFPKGEDLWLHGDFIEVTGTQGQAGGVVVYGRSDATLNPGGVRIGTAEIYRLVETLDEIEDSLVVGVPKDGDVEVTLFLKTRTPLTEELRTRVKSVIRKGASPRHVPGAIHEVPDIPYTISGKKVELAVLGILQGEEPKNEAALANPKALDGFRPYAAV